MVSPWNSFSDTTSGAVKKDPIRRTTVGDDLDILQQDKVIKTEPSDNKWRRTLQLKREQSASWGFTLQSYGIRHKTSGEVEMLTYVDYVEIGCAAYLAGLRPGDVIMSIDGVSMESADHPTLVHYIKAAGNTMRLVVLFEDCVRKVDLHLKAIKLQQLLADKMFELRSLEAAENRILNGENLMEMSCHSCVSSSSTLDSPLFDTASLRPELDVCPSLSHLRSSSPWQQKQLSSSQLDSPSVNRLEIPSPKQRSGSCSRLSDRQLSLQQRSVTPEPPLDNLSNHSIGSSIASESDKSDTQDYNYYSLPHRGKNKSNRHSQISEEGIPCQSKDGTIESTTSNSDGNLHSLVQKKMVNASVSGDISYARERFPSRPSWASFSSFRSDSYYIAPKKKSVKKSNSNRWSFRKRIHSNQMKMSLFNKKTADAVASETSSSNTGEPELISLRRLCHDFRMDYLHNSIAAGHKAQDAVTAMISRSNNMHKTNATMSRSNSDALSCGSSAQFYFSDQETLSVASSQSGSVDTCHTVNSEWVEMNHLATEVSKANVSGKYEKESCTESVATESSFYSLENDVFESRSSSPLYFPDNDYSSADNTRSSSALSQDSHKTQELINENDEDTRL